MAIPSDVDFHSGSSTASSSDESDAQELPEGIDLPETPMEKDLKLQIAEMQFRAALEGSNIGIESDAEISLEVWRRKTLGMAWVQRNRRQQKEIYRQVKATGEGTPAWTKTAGTIGDLAALVFEPTKYGVKLQEVGSMNRERILSQLQDLQIQLRTSFHARCSAGHILLGIEALVALFHCCIRDAEVLENCAICIRECVVGHAGNRDLFAELSIVTTEEDQPEDCECRGWSFLLHAINAFMVQVGEAPAGGIPWEEQGIVTLADASGKSAALRIAECVGAMRGATAAQVQLLLLSEPLPESPTPDRAALKELLPRAFAKATTMLREEPNDALVEFLKMIRPACPDEDTSVLDSSIMSSDAEVIVASVADTSVDFYTRSATPVSEDLEPIEKIETYETPLAQDSPSATLDACTSCGTALPPQAKFCFECGMRRQPATPVQTSPVPVTPASAFPEDAPVTATKSEEEGRSMFSGFVRGLMGRGSK